MRGLVFLAAGTAALAAGVAAKPFHTKFKSRDADFEFSWSSEAAAVPALVRRFTAEMRKQKAEVIGGGREFNQMRKRMGDDGDVGYLYSAKITTAGQTPRLLSLQTAIAHYMGGAHSNYGFDALLWDRRKNRQITVETLFLRAGAFQALTRPAYCKALDAERSKRRDGKKLKGEFGE